MEEYTVKVTMTAWAEISVVARNEEEATDMAYDMVDLNDAYDWEIDGAKVVKE